MYSTRFVKRVPPNTIVAPLSNEAPDEFLGRLAASVEERHVGFHPILEERGIIRGQLARADLFFQPKAIEEQID